MTRAKPSSKTHTLPGCPSKGFVFVSLKKPSLGVLRLFPFENVDPIRITRGRNAGNMSDVRRHKCRPFLSVSGPRYFVNVFERDTFPGVVLNGAFSTVSFWEPF